MYGQPGYPQGGMGIGMGMNSGMGGQFNNYQMQQYNVPRASIEGNAEQVFYKYDQNRNGFVPIQMLPQMMQDFSMSSGSPCPSQQDLQYMQWNFDTDGDGRLSYQEWIRALKMMGGHRSYDRGYLQQHRGGYGTSGMGGKFKGGKFKGGKGYGGFKGKGHHGMGMYGMGMGGGMHPGMGGGMHPGMGGFHGGGKLKGKGKGRFGKW